MFIIHRSKPPETDKEMLLYIFVLQFMLVFPLDDKIIWNISSRYIFIRISENTNLIKSQISRPKWKLIFCGFVIFRMKN